ncbi:cleavage and polyadenylation specificity factor subunit 1 isoform X1 [Tanacetum coccineum]
MINMDTMKIKATKVEITRRKEDDLPGYKNDHKHYKKSYKKSDGGFNQKMDQEDLKTYTAATILATEDDLRDILPQSLNPLRITVNLSNGTPVGLSVGTTSAPMTLTPFQLQLQLQQKQKQLQQQFQLLCGKMVPSKVSDLLGKHSDLMEGFSSFWDRCENIEVYSKEMKGAISAVASLQGYLLVASGPKIILHKWTGSDLSGVAFFDAPPLFLLQLSSLKELDPMPGLIKAGELEKSSLKVSHLLLVYLHLQSYRGT